MSFDAEKIYGLLPAIYRLRDHEQGESLKALLAVIAEQVGVLEEDLEQLYDNLFIETCEEWVVPYLGDLVGVRGLSAFSNARFSQRAQVANAIAYRRRKGTAAMLEQLARDVTNWPASVVEYFQLLATTQYMNHLRLREEGEQYWLRRESDRKFVLNGTVNLRNSAGLEQIGKPFDRAAHNLDVRRIESHRGLYNIPNIGIWLWRIGSYSITDATPFQVSEQQFKFDPLGREIQLFNNPEGEPDINHLATPLDVPRPITRRAMHRNLEGFHISTENEGHTTVISYKENEQVPESIVIRFEGLTVPPAVCSCDLSNRSTTWNRLSETKIAIDPELGRMAFPRDSKPRNVRVTWDYGFVTKMGGGEYERAHTFMREAGSTNRHIRNQNIVISETTSGVIELSDNDYYVLPEHISVGAGKKIEIRAANGRRPVLIVPTRFSLTGGKSAEITFNGCLLAGASILCPDERANSVAVTFKHCTLVSGKRDAFRHGNVTVPAQSAESLRIEILSSEVKLTIESSITGPVQCVANAPRVVINNSILDAQVSSLTSGAYTGLPESTQSTGDHDPVPHAGAGAPLKIENSTILGRVNTVSLEASNVIFYDTVTVSRKQEGCVRYSYVPTGSQTPRRFECQPGREDDDVRVRPQFASTDLGHPAYGQLSKACPKEITQGADDQSEMGAFHNLYQPQREAALRARLDEYLRFGLEAGILYAS